MEPVASSCPLVSCASSHPLWERCARRGHTSTGGRSCAAAVRRRPGNGRAVPSLPPARKGGVRTAQRSLAHQAAPTTTTRRYKAYSESFFRELQLQKKAEAIFDS